MRIQQPLQTVDAQPSVPGTEGRDGHIEKHGQQGTDQTPESGFTDPTDHFWSLYLAEADKEDRMLIESWNGDTNAILIFVRAVFYLPSCC